MPSRSPTNWAPMPTTPSAAPAILQSFLFRATRLVVDTGLHSKGWSREQATDYMVATTGFARPRTQREVERYCTRRPGLQLQGRPHRLDAGPRRSPEGAGRQVRPQAVPRSPARRRHAAGHPRTADQGTQPSVTMADTTDIPGGVVHDLPEDLASARSGDPRALATWNDITPLARNEWICWSESAKKQETRAQARRLGPREPRRRQAPTLLLARLQASLSAAPNPLSPPPGSTPAADGRWR